MKNLAVLSCFKNESAIIVEWIEHYLKEGVEHIYLIDNDSSDNYLCKIQPYIDKELVTLYIRPVPYIQTLHLNEIYKIIKDNYKWLVMVDLDEFIFAPNYKNLNIYLQNKQQYAGIYANWTNFGSYDKYEQPTSVIDSFLWRWKDYAGETKGIIQCSKTKEVHLHRHVHVDKEPVLDDNNELKVFHYQIQSREYFDKVKAVRGDAIDMHSNSVRNAYYFQSRDRREVYEDTLKLRQKNKLV